MRNLHNGPFVERRRHVSAPIVARAVRTRRAYAFAAAFGREGDRVDWTTFAIAFGIILTASVISGLAGFGFGLVAIPPLLMLYPPAAVLAVTKILTLSTSWVVIVHGWRHARPRLIMSVFPAAVVGTFGGLWLLSLATPEAIKIAAGLIVISFAITLMKVDLRGRVSHPAAGPIAGLASGALSTTVGMAGPPVIIHFTLRDTPVHAFRISIAVYFVLLDILGLPALILRGFATREDLVLAVLMVPAALGGRIIGIRLSGKVSRDRFYQGTLVLLVITGSIAVVGAIMSLR
jgi:uncharacterized protein